MVQTEVGNAAEKGDFLRLYLRILLVVVVVVFRTSTSCAIDLLWSTWEALITMQHNLTQNRPPRGVQVPPESCPLSFILR